jgi:hypothetical protein
MAFVGKYFSVYILLYNGMAWEMNPYLYFSITHLWAVATTKDHARDRPPRTFETLRAIFRLNATQQTLPYVGAGWDRHSG